MTNFEMMHCPIAVVSMCMRQSKRITFTIEIGDLLKCNISTTEKKNCPHVETKEPEPWIVAIVV